MAQRKTKKFYRFSPLHNKRFIDRYGQLLDLPPGTVSKTRVGIFGITISSNNKILVACPPHALDMPGLPGGGREGIETHAKALQREYFEEVGPYFVIKESRPVYSQRILYYATDKNEYWRYDQYFYFTVVHHSKLRVLPWASPEGGCAMWIPLREYQRVTASHRPAIERYLKMR